MACDEIKADLLVRERLRLCAGDSRRHNLQDALADDETLWVPFMLTRQSKFEVVRQLASGQSGTLMDVGARDRVLKTYLDGTDVKYVSCDIEGNGHDYTVNLENPLPFGDKEFDFVAALDVVEHVENFHSALDELIRVSKKAAIIALPNMSALEFRLTFLMKGRLNGKYDLPVSHPGDRHRWLTVYDQMQPVVEARAHSFGCSVERIDVLKGFGVVQVVAANLPLPPSLRAYTSMFVIRRQ